MLKNNVALITGASSGLGAEFARIHAKKGCDLVLVARNKQKLTSLKVGLEDTHGINVKIISKDLSEANASQEIYEEIKNEGIDVSVLINNAGIGFHSEFKDLELVKIQKIININITALTELTRLFLPEMLDRNVGKILNVSSTASFMPGPYQSVYYASKSYVTSFSQAIWEEVSDTNVSVSVICPGVINTNFFESANMDDLPLFKKAKPAAIVAKIGYKGMEDGELIIFDEKRLELYSKFYFPVISRKKLLKMSKGSMQKK